MQEVLLGDVERTRQEWLHACAAETGNIAPASQVMGCGELKAEEEKDAAPQPMTRRAQALQNHKLALDRFARFVLDGELI